MKKQSMVVGVLVALLALARQCQAQPGPSQMISPSASAVAAAMVVGERGLFVLVGQKIYKFNAETLELEGQTALPRRKAGVKPARPSYEVSVVAVGNNPDEMLR